MADLIANIFVAWCVLFVAVLFAGDEVDEIMERRTQRRHRDEGPPHAP